MRPDAFYGSKNTVNTIFLQNEGLEEAALNRFHTFVFFLSNYFFKKQIYWESNEQKLKKTITGETDS